MHIYSQPISSTSINNVIILLNHYLKANPKLSIISMDANSNFTS